MRKLFLFAAVLYANVGLSAEKNLPIEQNEDNPEQLVEHCRSVKKKTICYLEAIDSQGHSSFLASGETWKSMRIDIKLAEESGHAVSIVTDEDYNKIIATNDAERMDYSSPNPVGITPYSWECSLGVAGGTLSGGLAGGAAFGPIGLWAGAVGGGLYAAAEFCF